MGSGGGIKALLAGALDLAVSSRPPNDSETQAGAQALEYGRTALVFVTASSSPHADVTTQSLIDAYSGKTNTWPDGSKLRMVLRPQGDSDSDAIKALSPAMREAKQVAENRKGMVMATTDQEAATAIEKISGAIGPTTLALMLSEKRPLKVLTLNGVTPSPQTLASGKYPLSKTMQLVTGPQNQRSGTRLRGLCAVGQWA